LVEKTELLSGFQEVFWYSSAVQKRMAFLLYLPIGYHKQPTEHYPVLYLLHGSGHDRHSVLREVQPQEHVPMLGAAMLVIPDGGQGWWLDSPILPRSLFGQYVLQLVEFVDRHYRTLAFRTARGIFGFSMGGYGAMLLAAQHPEMFSAASSLLGPLDIVQLFPDYHRLRLLLGSDLGTWQCYNPTHWVPSLAHTALRFCTGEEAFDRPQNEAFAAALESLQILFEYDVYPGGHDIAFVRKHIKAHFSFHRRSFDQGARG